VSIKDSHMKKKQRPYNTTPPAKKLPSHKTHKIHWRSDNHTALCRQYDLELRLTSTPEEVSCTKCRELMRGKQGIALNTATSLPSKE